MERGSFSSRSPKSVEAESARVSRRLSSERTTAKREMRRVTFSPWQRGQIGASGGSKLYTNKLKGRLQS
jgi:hypothetical protein